MRETIREQGKESAVVRSERVQDQALGVIRRRSGIIRYHPAFDQMAQALHYHMYQLVLIANNGAYGGSNAHLPKGEAYQRQVFHTHGQPQATISFFEIDDIEGMKQRHKLGAGKEDGWKYPPAGCPT